MAKIINRGYPLFRKFKEFNCFVFLFLFSSLILTFPLILYALSDQPVQSSWIPNGVIRGTAEGPDGMTYLGGEFNRISPYSGSAVPIDLMQNSVLPQFPKINGTVQVIISDGKGGWYLGGLFDRVGEKRIRNLVHILPDYSVDLKFQPDPDDRVNTLALSGDKKFLYVGGFFKAVFDENLRLRSMPILFRFNIEMGILDSSWQPNPSPDIRGLDSSYFWINAIITSGDTLYVAGFFNSMFGEKVRDLAKFNNGILDKTFKPALISDDALSDVWIDSLALDHEMLYVAGQNLDSKGIKKGLVRFNKDILDVGWDSTVGASRLVSSLSVHDDFLYAAMPNEGLSGGLMIRFNKGTVDPNWKLTFGGRVSTIAFKDNALYVGGYFQTVRDLNGKEQSAQYLAKFDRGVFDPLWHPLDIDFRDGSVNTIAMNEDGKVLYVGGGFHAIKGEAVSGLMRLKRDGDPDFDWKPGFDSSVYALLADEDTLYVGAYSGLARFQKGVFDANWKPIFGAFDNQVTALAFNQKFLYTAGGFGYVKDADGKVQPIHSLARFREAVLDNTWKPNPIFTDQFGKESSGFVRTLAVNGDIVYVAGFFDKIFDKNRTMHSVPSLARFNQGELDAQWKPNLKAVKSAGRDILSVNALAIAKDFLYVGGLFQTEDGKIKNLARFNLNSGTLDPNWHPNPSYDSMRSNPASVNTLIAEGNTLYVGGSFPIVFDANDTDKPIRYLAKFDNGNLDLNWHPNRDCNVWGLARGKDSLYVSGYVPNPPFGGNVGCFFQFRSFIQFAKNEIKKDRKNESIDLEVHLSEPDLSPVTVDYAVTGGTAKRGIDYELSEGTLKFAPGETQKVISLKIKPNPKETSDLTVEISLLNPTGVFFGENKKLIYTIKKTFTTTSPPPDGSSQLDLVQNVGGCSLVQLPPESLKIDFLIYWWSGIGLIFLQRKRLKREKFKSKWIVGLFNKSKKKEGLCVD